MANTSKSIVVLVFVAIALLGLRLYLRSEQKAETLQKLQQSRELYEQRVREWQEAAKKEWLRRQSEDSNRRAEMFREVVEDFYRTEYGDANFRQRDSNYRRPKGFPHRVTIYGKEE